MSRRRSRATRLSLTPLEGRSLLSGLAAHSPDLAHRSPLPGAFRANFVGHFDAGPDRFNGSPFTLHVTSNEGGSSTSMHTSLRMSLSRFADPNTPLTGQAAFIDRNVTTTGSTLVLDLKGDPASLDSRGRPTAATWTVDGASGGLYSDATGTGTVIITYRPGRPVRGAAASGTAVVRFSGQLLTTRLTNVINNL